MTNDEIKNIISVKKQEKEKKYGINKIYKVDDNKVFIKAVPIAKIFIENMFDTSNLYNVPAYYNYGFGSAGINPWRELLLHIKTTNFVLENKCDFFPLLYHYRIIEDDNNVNIESGLDKKLLKKWNNDKNIKKYLNDRINGKHKIVLFLEYIPNVSYKYLEENSNKVKSFYDQTKNIIEFMNKNGISHNDGHLGNYIVDDNGIAYLTDFGLSLDNAFGLNKNEVKFKKMNKNLDKYYIIDNMMSDYLFNCLGNKKIMEKYSIDPKKTDVQLYQYLIEIIDDIKKDIKISDFQIKFIKTNKSYIIKFIKFISDFENSTDKNNYYIK